jgi:hypothetical protein
MMRLLAVQGHPDIPMADISMASMYFNRPKLILVDIPTKIS